MTRANVTAWSPSWSWGAYREDKQSVPLTAARGDKGVPRNTSRRLGCQTLWFSGVRQAYSLMETPARDQSKNKNPSRSWAEVVAGGLPQSEAGMSVLVPGIPS